MAQCSDCGRNYSTDEMATHRICKGCRDMGNPIREIDGVPLRWESPAGIIHAAEGDRIVAHDPATFILWTVCQMHDVPAGRGFKSHAAVTCPNCINAQ